MAMVWDPTVIPGVLAVLLAAGLAIVVWRADPARPINRRLATLLAVEALNVFASFSVADKLTDDPATRYAWAITVFTSDVFLIAAYLSFVGLALPTPLVRVFRTRCAVWALWSSALIIGTVLATSPTKLMPSVAAPTAFGPWLWGVWASVALAFGFGLIAAAHAWATATPTGARRLRLYLIAFGVRDLGFIVFFGALVYWGLQGAFSPAAWFFLPLFQDLVMLIYIPLLAYGLLRTQLFDIDLKVKFAVEKSTIVAAFAVAFVVASELAETLLAVEGFLFGLAAAILIALFFRRVERLSAHLADRLLPGVENTPAYRALRKGEIYRAAAEAAIQDGPVTSKERSVLDTLAGTLGLDRKRATAIERRAQRILRGPRSAAKGRSGAP